MNRDNNGRFSKGNVIGKAGGRPIGSLGSLNKEMLARVKARGNDDDQFIDVLLMDIAFDTDIDVNTRLKAASKMADVLFTKNAATMIDEKEVLSSEELDKRIKELLVIVEL